MWTMRLPQLVQGVVAWLVLESGLGPGARAQPVPDGPAQAQARPGAAPAGSPLQAGLTLFQQRQFAAAARWLEQARGELEPKTSEEPELLLMLGICYYRTGDLSRAEPLLREAERSGDATEKESARLFLGLLFQEAGAVDQARTEFGRVAGSAELRDSAQRLLQHGRPHRILLTLIVLPEYDANVPLTSYAPWSSAPQSSADGDMLFLASLSARPFAFGLTIGNTFSYRQQFQLSAYNFLTNSTWLGYSYFGFKDRLRLQATFNYAMLGRGSLYVDVGAKASYRRKLWSQLGLNLTYDGRYRDYLNADYLPLTGVIQTLQSELGWGLIPRPLSAGIGYQLVREQTREPSAAELLDGDYRAWAHGPTLWLRARLHQRVELAFNGTFLHRIFDYVPGPELPDEQGIRRIDHALSGELTLNFKLTSWLELFGGSLVLYNESNKAPFWYFKPTAYLGAALYLGLL